MFFQMSFQEGIYVILYKPPQINAGTNTEVIVNADFRPFVKSDIFCQ